MTTTKSAALFEANQVGFQIAGRWLLQDVTLTVSPGRVLGLIGHNGSGKTTLMKLLARQLSPSKGMIRLVGASLDSWKDRAFARKAAYFPQSPPVAPGLLVRELVALGRYPWHGPLGRFSSNDHAKVDEAMTLAQVDAFGDREVGSLSGGERQRAWLAMLLAHDAACLLLDEPTSALDVAHQFEVLRLVRQLSHKRGLAILLVLHDVNLAARFCDELAALRRGRLLAHGATRELMREDMLEAVYGLPMGIVPHPVSGQPMSYVP
ncbi:MAG TPA: ATP-binding cassette domain-containing protein [Geminicoccus sp.]|jgi:iron complex transport system ATP-binding protein|uniref:ATP-binding cassette domain-containing protein n=1 Tax=Geminicoccus sp. TaxID=2024832 RepID=UPI002E31BD74|nr:ATP-binding cassette domain-containing protein [Geminicoccus sp.]HEX2524995.1 ATP-binding cassette domain-containing protein [Geminicoccus sp.]